jgi:hypothetical protein
MQDYAKLSAEKIHEIMTLMRETSWWGPAYGRSI